MIRFLKLISIFVSLCLAAGASLIFTYSILLHPDQPSLAWVLIALCACVAIIILFMSIDLSIGNSVEQFQDYLRRIGLRARVTPATPFSPEFEKLRLELEQTLARLRQESKELQKQGTFDAERYKFIQILSHRLRTPLGGLSWALSLLEESGGAKPAQEDGTPYLSIAKQSLERIQNLIEELLEAATVETKNPTQSLQILSVNALVQNALDESDALAKSKHMTIETHFSELPDVRGDKMQLSSAIQNVVSNAILYGDENSAISISAAEKGTMIELTVEDRGIEILRHEEPFIFQPLWRGQKAVQKHTEGTGMGLYFAKEILENHGGSISFSSKDGITTFHLLIPAVRDAALDHYLAK